MPIWPLHTQDVQEMPLTNRVSNKNWNTLHYSTRHQPWTFRHSLNPVALQDSLVGIRIWTAHLIVTSQQKMQTTCPFFYFLSRKSAISSSFFKLAGIDIFSNRNAQAVRGKSVPRRHSACYRLSHLYKSVSVHKPLPVSSTVSILAASLPACLIQSLCPFPGCLLAPWNLPTKIAQYSKRSTQDTC